MNTLIPNYIHYAGVPDDIMNGDLLYDNVDDDKRNDYKHSLLHFVKHTSLINMTIFPNFEVGWVFPPSGYVASFPKTAPFSNDPFLAPYFRIISFTEITYSQQIIEHCISPKSQERIRKCIPLETATPPDLRGDTEDSGWGCALGYDGCSIGLYKFTENVTGSDNASIRLFIGVHSGLHPQTLQKLYDYDYEIAAKNRDIANKTPSSTTTTSDGSSGLELVTYGAEFSVDSMKMRLLSIAKENNKRLAALYASLLGLTTISHITTDNKLPYRQTEAALENAINKETLDKALAWWPKNAPIYSNTRIPVFKEELSNITDEARAILPPEAIQGYALGRIIWEARNLMKQKDATAWDKFTAAKSIQFEDMPAAVDPIAECEYNTFRIENNEILWYCGCSPTKKLSSAAKNSCVIRQLPLAHGYECTDSQIPHDAFETATSFIEPWTNQALNGYPTIFHYSPTENRVHNITEDTENTFFSLYHGPNKLKRLLPTQLKYSLKRKPDMKTQQIKEDLFPSHKKTNQIVMVPISVYLSPELPFSNTYSMKYDA